MEWHLLIRLAIFAGKSVLVFGFIVLLVYSLFSKVQRFRKTRRLSDFLRIFLRWSS